ncbi:MAG: hypothetical protein N3I35_10685 [Clostridia bacterium]|nr:hypothetical protein [Clostridia bacterium]
MVITFLSLNEILTHILNVLLISIPEETFLVVFTLIILKKFDNNISLNMRQQMETGYKEYCQFFTRNDISKIIFTILTVGSITQFLRFLKINQNLILIGAIILLFLCIITLYKLYSTVENILKAFTCTFCSILTLIVIEFSYVPLMLYFTGETVDSLNKSILLNFIFSLPERTIEYTLLAYILLKKSSFSKLNLLKVVLYSKPITISTIIIFLINILFLLSMGKIIIFDKALITSSHSIQILIPITVFLFSAINIVVYVSIIYHLINREIYNKFVIQENLNSYIYDIKFFSNSGNYDKMISVVHSLQDDVNNY